MNVFTMSIKVNLHPWFYKIFVFDLVTSWPQVTWRDLYTREAFLFAVFFYWKSNFCMSPLHGNFFGNFFGGYFYKKIIIFFSWSFIGIFPPGEQHGLGDEPLVDVEPRNWKKHIGHHERLTATGFNSSAQLVTSKVTSMARIWRKSLNVCAHLAEGRLRLFCV